MKESRSLLLKKYISQAENEVAQWPEWKKKQALLYCSEDQIKNEEHSKKKLLVRETTLQRKSKI